MSVFEKLLLQLNLERRVIPCPEISMELYPSPDHELQARMMNFKQMGVPVNIVIFLKYFAPDSKPYLDITVLDDDLQQQHVLGRFVICEGYRLNAEMECRFLEITRGLTLPHLITDFTAPFSLTEKEIRRVFPQWHYIEYGCVSEALEHMYFASHPCFKELLYKSELTRIASKSDSIEINILGKTPVEVIPDALPLKLLHIINSTDEFVSDLFNEEGRLLHKKTYDRYASYLGKDLPSVGQWKYLLELTKNNGLFNGLQFNRALYNRLLPVDSERYLPFYRKYLEKTGTMHVRNRIPRLLDVEKFVGKFEAYEKYGMNNLLNEKIIKRHEHEREHFEYSNDALKVIMPDSVSAFVNEAVVMKNCLLEEYMEAHSNGATTILFIRQKFCPSKSFVSIEIKQNKLVQAYAKENNIPNIEAFRFLNEYCQKKDIIFDLDGLISGYIEIYDDPDVISDELWSYYEEVEKHENVDEETEEEQYIQLTFFDLYPELFPRLKGGL